MKKDFPRKEFQALASPVLDTDFFNQADEIYTEDFLHYATTAEENDDFYDSQLGYEDIMTAVEELVGAQPTLLIPKELAHLLEYVYNVAIDNKDAERINNYGTLFYTGQIGNQDFAMAEKFYKMAASLGCAKSIENLGYIYYYGRTGEVDYEKAFRQFAECAILYNRPISIYKLGDLYKNGYYVEKNEQTAFLLYRRANDIVQKNSLPNDDDCTGDVCFRLGDCFHRGIGTEPCLDLALDFFQKAEVAFIDRLRQGDFLIKKMLTTAIDRQEEIRRLIAADLPDMEWAKKNTGYNTL